MPILESLYTGVLGVAQGALPLLSRGEGKLARGIRGRRGVLDRMEWWARQARSAERPLVWFHAPSVGEGLQARAVMEAFRRRRPDAQVVYTFFSPSAEGLAGALVVDFADYLPLDLPRRCGRALDLLRPDVLAFSKYDVWPNLTREAARRGVSLALLSATLPASSSRMTGVARALLRPAYGRLHRVAAISEADAARFGELGVVPERRTVMGDARFDQVWARAAAVDRGSEMLTRLGGFDGITVVAGSTWPLDEEHLTATASRIASRGARLRLILVPHEPTREHLSGAESLLRRYGLPHRRLSHLGDQPPPSVVLVDAVGVLGDLYSLADLAYVGGGWGQAGLHSVLEPAAFGAPVIFGPNHANAREAAELIAAGGGFSVQTTDALEATLERLVLDPVAREGAGTSAREFVRSSLGAADRGAAIIEELLDGR